MSAGNAFTKRAHTAAWRFPPDAAVREEGNWLSVVIEREDTQSRTRSVCMYGKREIP